MNRLLLIAALATPSFVLAAPHPVHDDGGAVNWRLTWKDTVDQARKTGRPILLQGCNAG